MSKDRRLQPGWMTELYFYLAIALGTNSIFFVFNVATRGKPAELPTALSSTQPGYILMWLLLWAWTAILIARSAYRNEVQWSLVFALPVIALVFGSALWSVSPATTLYFGSILTANIFVAYVLATTRDPDFFLSVLKSSLALCVFASFLLLMISPETAAAERFGGGWLGGLDFNGVFPHKSAAGYNFGLLLIGLISGAGGTWRPLAALAMGVIAFVALLFTNSATGLAGTIFVCFVIVAFRVLRLESKPILALIALGCVVFALVSPFLPFGGTAEFVGRDSGLTGRAPIWAAGIEAFLKRPMLGYGYDGFFYPGDFSPVWDVWNAESYFKTPHFHNSGIEVAVSFGVVGLVVYGLILLVAFFVIGNATLSPKVRLGLVAALWLMTLSSAFDFTFLFHNSFGSIFLFYCFFASQTAYAHARTEQG